MSRDILSGFRLGAAASGVIMIMWFIMVATTKLLVQTVSRAQ